MSIHQLQKIIHTFTPIGLDEMDSSSSLMDRVDTKFLLTLDELCDVLPKIQDEYRILEIENVRFPSYESEYYDAADFSFYLDHHRKRLDRFKLRYRKYVESDISFLEVKHKKKGRTNKQRIKVADLPGGIIPPENVSFIKSTGIEHEKLVHTLTNSFNRVTLVGTNVNERLTFDFNLTFKKDGKTICIENIVIAELKQAKLNRTSPFYTQMKQRLIRPFRISKYCIGMIELYGKTGIKYNRFKKKLLKIKKLQKRHSNAA